MLVVVSIDDQMAYVYRNGVQIARSTVSTGKPGKETPTGVFTILQRKVSHESSIYKGAQMPYMQRLTWSGVAMHAGDLPGYPASAGCVRLPYEFSQKVYGVMGMGTTVAITRKGARPASSGRPADVLLASRAGSADNRAIPDPEGRVVWNPGKSPSGPFSVLLSYADRTAYVWRNGVLIGQSPIGVMPGSRPPEGVFVMLAGGPPNRWSTLSLNGGQVSGDAAETIRSMVRIPEDFRSKVASCLTPGTILVATSERSTAATRSGTGFQVIGQETR